MVGFWVLDDCRLFYWGCGLVDFVLYFFDGLVDVVGLDFDVVLRVVGVDGFVGWVLFGGG